MQNPAQSPAPGLIRSKRSRALRRDLHRLLARGKLRTGIATENFHRRCCAVLLFNGLDGMQRHRLLATMTKRLRLGNQTLDLLSRKVMPAFGGGRQA